jgi:hypothetical protein
LALQRRIHRIEAGLRRIERGLQEPDEEAGKAFAVGKAGAVIAQRVEQEIVLAIEDSRDNKTGLAGAAHVPAEL